MIFASEITWVGGNSKYLLGMFHPEKSGFHDSQFDYYIFFQLGWFNHQLVADFLETFSWMGGSGGDPKNKMFRDAKCAVSIFCVTQKCRSDALPNFYPTSHFTSI